MAAKTSVKTAQRAAINQETKLVKSYVKAQEARTGDINTVSSGSFMFGDSFQNFLLGMGMNTDNANTANTYGFNPITRNRVLCEWIYRGSWIGGVACEVPANDMTRAGVEYPNGMEPEDTGKLDTLAAQLNVWGEINETIKWGRCYGGAITVCLIDGQDPSTPLRIETIGKDQFKGLLTLDRWMVDPTLDDLVTEMGPHMGLPKYYRVLMGAPALRGRRIHHSRVMVRHCGVRLPYNQRLTENLWGMSIFERLYDRLTAFDMASTGAAQLIAKAYLRTLKVKGLRQIIAAGGKPLQNLVAMVNFMRTTQNNEGITLIDNEDEFTVDQHQAFSGLDSIIQQFASQLAGALQIPMTRLMGQSPGGLNATGESDENIYYENIGQAQTNELFHGVQTIYQLMAASLRIKLPSDFRVSFAPLKQLADVAKSEIAAKDVTTITTALQEGLISPQTTLMELRQLSRRTGRFTNITQKMIDEADDALPEPPASPEELLNMQADIDAASKKSDQDFSMQQQQQAQKNAVPGVNNGSTARQNGKKGAVADRAPRREAVFV